MIKAIAPIVVRTSPKLNRVPRFWQDKHEQGNTHRSSEMKRITAPLTLIALLCVVSCKEDAKVLTDPRDGKTYKTVKIGNQTWMAENLNYEAEGSKCYEDNPEYCQKYGRLYSKAMAENACPEDWHLPSDVEWQEFIDFAGGIEVAGKKLRAKSIDNSPDNYGFSALMSGGGNFNGQTNTFWNVGGAGFWWSATKDNVWVVSRMVEQVSKQSFPGTNYKSSNKKKPLANSYFLYSVRCIGEQVNPAVKELRTEAKKWQDAFVEKDYEVVSNSYKPSESKYFSYEATNSKEGGDYYYWTATSKAEINGCPAKSVWKMHYGSEGDEWGGNHEVPPKCEAITPKVITDYNPGGGNYGDECGDAC